MNSFTGWKCKAAGVGAVLWGAGEVLLALTKPELGTTVDGGMDKIFGGLGLLGLAHKIEKAGAPS